jgi:hypothetical protein
MTIAAAAPISAASAMCRRRVGVARPHDDWNAPADPLGQQSHLPRSLLRAEGFHLAGDARIDDTVRAGLDGKIDDGDEIVLVDAAVVAERRRQYRKRTGESRGHLTAPAVTPWMK